MMIKILASISLLIGTATISALGIFASPNDTVSWEKFSAELTKSTFRPVAVTLSDSEANILAASSNGELAVMDSKTGEIQSRNSLGSSLSDLARWKDGYLATDFQSHELIYFQLNENFEPVVRWKKHLSKYPSRIAVSDTDQIAVSCHWSRRLEIFSPSKLVGKTVDLTFVPGKLKWLPGSSSGLLVAEAFSDKVAVVDQVDEVSPEIEIRELPDRRTGDFDFVDNQLIFATQMLNPLAQSTRNDVHWGLMVSNDVESFEVAKFIADKFNYSNDRNLIPIGGAGDAKADPEKIVITTQGVMLVAMGGANQLAIGKPNELDFAYIHVGTRPVDIAVDSRGKFCYVANELDGSISIVDLDALERVKTVELNEDRELTLVEQGERLFFDASLSHDGWMSCHSCHVEGHTNGLVNDNLSDQTFGTPKRVLSLLGHAKTEPLSWTGDNETMDDQVFKSIKVTMQSDDQPKKEWVEAIGAFVKQLKAPPSLADSREVLDEVKVKLGREVFMDLHCSDCHVPPKFTSSELYDVGLSDEKGKTKFNPPSLIGVGQRDLFFHDGRAEALEEVFGNIVHQLPNDFSDEKLSNLLAFLNSL